VATRKRASASAVVYFALDSLGLVLDAAGLIRLNRCLSLADRGLSSSDVVRVGAGAVAELGKG
jgi:hypothetical protein